VHKDGAVVVGVESGVVGRRVDDLPDFATGMSALTGKNLSLTTLGSASANSSVSLSP
jgi:hypothetical protein